jgi:ACS family hexuronate transporter-like MFS transporter
LTKERTNTHDEHNPQARAARGRIVVMLLLVVTIINYITRQTLPVLAPELQKELHFSSLQYSYVLNSFLVVYAVMYPLMGRFIDRVGTRKGLGFAVIFWSVIQMLHATATGVISLCVWRALLAVGEAAIIPAAVKAVAEWFDAKQRGMAVGIFEMGLSLGPLIAPLLVVWISLRYGWHQAFLLTGFLGLVWVVPWFWLYYDPERSAADGAQNSPHREPQRPIPWVEIFRSRDAWAIGVARFFADPVWYFFLFWMPKYLSDSRGLSLSGIALYAWIPYLASLAGGLASGAASSWLMRRGVDTIKARLWVMLVSAVLVSSSVLIVYMSRLLWVLIFMSIAAFAMLLWGATVDTLPTDLFPPKRTAQTVGFGGMMGALGGILFTAGTGYVVQHYSYTPVWVASAVMYPFGLVLSFLLLRRPPSPAAEVAPSGLPGLKCANGEERH